jgi:ABC-type transport system involved in multi-copper enzyme maturation permease subunit
LNSIWPIAKITFKEGVRHRVVYGVIVASCFLIFFSIILCGLFMRDLLKVLLDICLSATSISGLLVPLFFAINQLRGDIDRKTIYTILSRPVSRAQYIFGRFLGLALLSGTLICITTMATLISVYGATFVYPSNIFANLSAGAILLNSFLLFFGIQILNSCVLFWTSLTSSSFLATLLTISTYLIGHTVTDLIRFIKAQGETVYVHPFIQNIVFTTQYIFPNLAAFDQKQFAAHGLSISYYEILLLITYGVFYCTIMVLLSIFFFQKRDL